MILQPKIGRKRNYRRCHRLLKLYWPPLFYFDHNATTPVAPEVAAAFAAALREVPGNASSTHRAGQFARERLESARSTVSDSLHCRPTELVFTSGGTESNNLAILGLVRQYTARSKHVITTEIEHPAVLEPVRQLAREGVHVTFCKPCITEIERAIRPETVLISAMHANNETGAIQPVREIAGIMRERRAGGQTIFFHSDGVQALGKIAVNVVELGVDLYSVSAHKIHGPKGVGALFVRQGTPLHGVQFGGRHERDRRAGTENVPGAIAFACAVELLGSSAADNLRELRDRFERRVLEALDNVEANGAQAERLPNTSNLLFHGLSGETLLIALDTAGYAVSTGSACASGAIEPSHVLLAMGRTKAEARSSVRFSFGRTNTPHEVDSLAEAVIAAVHRLRKSKQTRSQLVTR